MSEKVENKPVEKVAKKPGEELVSYTAPLLPGQEKQDIVVGVNGQFVRIQRGETVQVKAMFVEAINNAAKQQVAAHKAAAKAQRAEKMFDL